MFWNSDKLEQKGAEKREAAGYGSSDQYGSQGQGGGYGGSDQYGNQGQGGY